MEFISNKRIHSILSLFLPPFVGVIIGMFFLGSSLFTMMAVCLLPSLLLIKAKPEIGILAIVVLISSVFFEAWVPLIPIGVGSFNIADVILLSLLCTILFNLVIDKEFRLIRTPLDKPLVLFYLAAIISACIGIFQHHMDFHTTIRIFRIVTYYLLFFAVTNLIRDERQLRFLVKGLFFIGCIVGIAMLAQALLGESVRLMPGRIEKAGTFHMTFEATRVLPPGQTLVYVLFVTSVCLIALDRKAFLKTGHYLLVFFTGIGVTLTYNRSYWVACIVCFIMFMLFTPIQARKRIVFKSLLLVLSVALILSLFLLSKPSGRAREALTSISARFSSLFAAKELYDSDSLDYRRIENRYALPKIAKNPLLGIGLGNEYRPKVFGPDDDLLYYIHNGYIWILMKTGLIGFVPFLWFFLGFIVRGFRNWKNIRNNYLRSLVTGFTLSGAGVALANIVNPMFMQWFSIVVLSIIIGLSEGIIRLNEREVLKQSE